MTSAKRANAMNHEKYYSLLPPKINPFSFSSDLYEGSRTAVTCVVVAGDRPIFIKWLKDGRQLTDGDHGASIFVTAEDYVSTLTLDNLSRRFNGNYTCKASNVIGTDSASAYLEVKTPPYWTIPPVDSRAIVGKSIMLHCQAEGYPTPHIRWKVAKGMPPGAYNTIISSSRVYILVNGSLTITSVRKEDEGLYLCEASNGLGQPISSAISLTVHSPPNFRSKFSTQTLQKGERATVPCNSIGEKPIFIQWLKNGKKFSPSDQRRYIYREDPTPEGKLAEITIPSTTRDDSAIYTCIARNEFGEDSMNAQVTIQEVPDIPNNIRVEKITSRDLVLSWSPPYNGNSDITEYNVQWREAHGNWNQITIRGTVTTIENLRPQTLYGFRVRAKNALGAGSYSNEIQEKSATEPPQTAPSGVRVVPVTSRTIMVSWLVDLPSMGYSLHRLLYCILRPQTTSVLVFCPSSSCPDYQHFYGSAAVYEATNRETELIVAVKKIYLSQQPYKEDLITELLVLREMKHPNVVNYLDSYLIGDELWVWASLPPAAAQNNEVTTHEPSTQLTSIGAEHRFATGLFKRTLETVVLQHKMVYEKQQGGIVCLRHDSPKAGHLRSKVNYKVVFKINDRQIELDRTLQHGLKRHSEYPKS
ncbi:cell adhesion molecule Dscam1-like [Tachypleus tridentatus]|uniref:cell adhesion molecule Dscam1-like n=1 Tax=Tachypleus tridentatus TaxID=6853 RepID=UPI003FD3A6FD